MLDPSQIRPLVEENPSYLAVDYADDDVILYVDGSVKAGTLRALVERLTLHDRTGEFPSALILVSSSGTDERSLRSFVQCNVPDDLSIIRDWGGDCRLSCKAV